MNIEYMEDFINEETQAGLWLAPINLYDLMKIANKKRDRIIWGKCELIKEKLFAKTKPEDMTKHFIRGIQLVKCRGGSQQTYESRWKGITTAPRPVPPTPPTNYTPFYCVHQSVLNAHSVRFHHWEGGTNPGARNLCF
jgi:hypothetical protein